MMPESWKRFFTCISLVSACTLLYGAYSISVLDLRPRKSLIVHDTSNKNTVVDPKPLNRNAVSKLESGNIVIDCVPTSSIRSQRTKRCVQFVDPNALWKESQEYACVDLKITEKTPICVHDPKIDGEVSRIIIRDGIWEQENVRVFSEALTRYNVTDVLDVGSHIGLYTLTAAKLKRRVVAIDANIKNLKLLSKSLVLGRLTDRVSLIWNAVSDVYTNVTLKIQSENVGHFLTQKGSGTNHSYLIETMLIDDLKHLFTNEIVAMKIGVEFSELLALRGAQSFLKNIKVKFIQMEIEHHKKLDSGLHIFEVLRSHGFTPFKNCLGVDSLTFFPVQKWPANVCFIRLAAKITKI